MELFSICIKSVDPTAPDAPTIAMRKTKLATAHARSQSTKVKQTIQRNAKQVRDAQRDESGGDKCRIIIPSACLFALRQIIKESVGEIGVAVRAALATRKLLLLLAPAPTLCFDSVYNVNAALHESKCTVLSLGIVFSYS